MGFVGDLVGGVVDVVGSVAEFVIDNALPIIETVALTYALGPAGLGLQSTFGISDLAVRAISNVAVTALNGGSMGSIVAAGLTPMLPEIGKSLGVDIAGAQSFINKPIAEALGNSDLAKMVASAAGSAVTGGAIAAVTGGDVLQAAAMAGLSPIVAKGMASTWSAIKEYIPALDTKQQQLNDLQTNINSNKQTLEGLNRFQNTINENGTLINSDPEFQKLNTALKTNLDGYNTAKDAGDIRTANSYASTINNDLLPKLQNNYTYNTLVPTYNSQVNSFNGLLSQNQGLLNQVMQANTLQNELNTMGLQIQSDYTNYQMTDALANGNYTDAAKYYADLQTYNSDLLKLNSNAVTTAPSLSTEQADFLNKYATDPSQYGSQASQVFADFKSTTPITNTTTGTATETTGEIGGSNLSGTGSATGTQTEPSGGGYVPTTPTTTPTTPTTTPTTPTTPTTGTSTSTNPYDNLPKYPGTETETPTTDTGLTNTGATNTGTTSLTSPVGNLTQNSVGNFVDSLGRAFTKQIINGVVTYTAASIINGGTPTPSTPPKPITPITPTIRRPPQHMDVSALTRYTGTLPTGVASTTPRPSITGGLPTITTPSNVTNPTQTPTQTGNSGLQSVSQPQVQASNSPAKHVNISTLTPVTNNTQLANLGLNIG